MPFTSAKIFDCCVRVVWLLLDSHVYQLCELICVWYALDTRINSGFVTNDAMFSGNKYIKEQWMLSSIEP